MKQVECEIAGPIVRKEASKQLAYAAVLVPGEPDSDGEILSPDRVEKAAHEWLAGYRNVDLQHTLNNVAVPVESSILPMDYTVDFGGKQVVLPKGTWILATKVHDTETWARVMKGELTGYSVMGIRRTAGFDAAGKSIEGAAPKRTLLEDLGEDWVAVAVSLVDTPAVPKAKFFAFKSVEAPKEQNFMDKLKNKLSTKESGAETPDVETVEEQIIEEDTMDKTEIEQLITEAVKSATMPLQEKLEALEAEKARIESETQEAAEKAKADKIAADEAAFKQEVTERLAELDRSIKNTAIKRRGLTEEDVSAGSSPDVSEKSARDSFGRMRRQ